MLTAGLDGLDRGCELGPSLEELEHGFGGGGHSGQVTPWERDTYFQHS
jgi:hypothetical protein